MQLIKVYGNTGKERASEIISKNFSSLNVNVLSHSEDGRYKLSIKTDEEENAERLVYRELVDALEDIIISIYLDGIIKDRIKKIYEGGSFHKEEDTLDRIKDEMKTSYLYIEEKMEIRDKLFDYVRENDSLDIDGYIRFRLHEYLYIVDTAIDSVISEIKEERKLDDFLNMIQHFVEIQNPKIDYLNVILRGNTFVLKDMDGEIVGSDIIERVRGEFKGEVVGRSDILLSTLIIMAPKRVVVHSRIKDVSLIAAISEIFKGRFVFCSGCDMCGVD